MNHRMDRTRLQIGVYHLAPYARTQAHIKDLADCGIDFVIGLNNDRTVLDLFSKYGVGAVVSGEVPGWWGGFGGNAGTMETTNPLEKYDASAAKFVDHPAIWGIDVGDEPSALDFPHYGKVIDRVTHGFPNQFAYLNIYPNYGVVPENTVEQILSQLGTPDYEAYIDAYCRHISSDYLCFDFYPYAVSVAQLYENLQVVSKACLENHKSMWIVLQVNSKHKEEWISENNLRFQTYTAMAFGAENIIWACYTAGWWHNQVLDEKGEKTQQYEKLKKVNGEIKKIATEYMKYRPVATYFVSSEAAAIGDFEKIHAEGGESLVIGQMISRQEDGSCALMVCGADDPYDTSPKSYRILFRTDRRVRVISGNGQVPVEILPDHTRAIRIQSNQGVLFLLD